jgi:hypothetical protein
LPGNRFQKRTVKAIEKEFSSNGPFMESASKHHRHEEFARRYAVDIDGVTMWFVTAED